MQEKILFEEAEKYMYGKEVKCSYEKAMELYLKAAEEGSCDAMYKLALIYRDGEIVSRDFSKSMEYYEKYAATGDNLGLLRLAQIYRKGEICKKDDEKAMELYLKAAQQGFDKAQNNLATMYKGKGDYVNAAYWYEQAVQQGNATAKKNLEDMLEYNANAVYKIAENILEKEPEKAQTLLRKAADKNHPEAICRLADLKSDEGGDGEELYIRAAHLGNARAAEILGDKYFEISLKKAEKYYKIAAYESDSAAEKLARCYTDSRRIFKKTAKAKKLLENLK